MRLFSKHPVLRILLLYVLFGGLWIAASDRILETFVSDTHTLTLMQTYKGWLFVAASAVLLFLVTQGEFRTRSRAEAALRKSEDQARVRLEHLSTLHAIDLIISSNLDLRLTLREIVNLVISQLHIDAADVLLLNPHTQMLEFAAMQGFRDNRIRHSRVRLGEGIAGRSALERRSITIPDLLVPDSGYIRTPLLEDEAFVAYVAVPLIAKGQVKGVLEVFHRSSLAFDEEWVDFLEALAAQAAIAIDNATLFNDLQRSTSELILAYDTTIEGWARALELRDRHRQRNAVQ